MSSILNKIYHRVDGYGLFNLVFGHLKWLLISIYKKLSKNQFQEVTVYNSKMIVDLYDDGLSKQLLKYSYRQELSSRCEHDPPILQEERVRRC